jgi:hypothetical protein
MPEVLTRRPTEEEERDMAVDATWSRLEATRDGLAQEVLQVRTLSLPDESRVALPISGPDEPAADRVKMLLRGRELHEQEAFVEGNPESRWTLQQFSTNPAGEPWLALQEHDDAGVARTVTGTREELNKLVSEHGL